ncbi:MAG: FeoB-associated Cys-rich membrane protein [Clostridia bacterium]|nr:FeoB-associated Cys-rich membrane protein [Clostridia bacterium]
MGKWLAENWVTIVALAAVLAVIGAALGAVVRDKKQGKSSCGSNCAHCPMAGNCHKK